MREQITKLGQVNWHYHHLAWPLIIFLLLSFTTSPFLNKASLILLCSYLLLFNFKDVLTFSSNSLKAYGLLLLILWDVASLTWSVTPVVSLRSVTNDLLIVIFALLAAYHARYKDVIDSFRLVSMTVIAMIVMYSIAFLGESFSPGGLKSFYHQKNSLGAVAAFCTVVLLVTFKKNVINYFFILLGSILLILSQSKTSLSLILIICLSILLIQGAISVYKRLAPYTQGFISLILKGASFLLYIGIAAMVLLRERIADYLITTFPYEALTGRGLLWVTVLTSTRDDLLICIGPGVFWSAERMSEIFQTNLSHTQPWVTKLGSVDGGYIDLIGALGFVGLSLFFLALMQLYRLIFRELKSGEWKLYFSLVTFFVVHSITESNFFRFTNYLWFTFLFLTFYLIFKQAKKPSISTEI